MNFLTSIAHGVRGFFLFIILFILCFLTVHAVKLARLGLSTLKKEEPKTEEKKPAEQSSGAKEQVYYLVEKRKRRAKRKTDYSTPKEFQFK
ncbi:MAG: hypothetical protein IJY38_03335 [Clostridia bacterium]|nr:hypothetical protein [Clostridia bacterium]